ncbi:MAG TPA: nuclear transport factor 2 family protein [Thermoanaerobaculia bacterium]|nr:nuclear transport factor 2 family protein [Thermoanaerobaculia bacterium]
MDTDNKKTVMAYMQAYARHDHPAILATLTDDVEWEVPGAFHTHGKDEFDAQIEGEGSAGPPAIDVTRLIEENDIVVAEGSVRAPQTNGNVVSLVYCDVFEMRGGKIRKLISYLMPKSQ